MYITEYTNYYLKFSNKIKILIQYKFKIKKNISIKIGCTIVTINQQKCTLYSFIIYK